MTAGAPVPVDVEAALAAVVEAGRVRVSARAHLRAVTAELAELVRAADAAGASRAEIARAAGTDRVTVYRMLGHPTL